MLKKKLLFFVIEDWYFCSHRLPLAKAAIKAGFEVSVVTRVRDHGDMIKEAGIRLIPLEQDRRSINPFSMFLTVVRLAFIYRNECPDIIHHVSLKPIILGSIAVFLLGNTKTVNALTGLGWLYSSSNYKALIFRRILNVLLKSILKSSLFIVQNSDDKAWLIEKGINEPSIKLIKGSGVDLDQYRPFHRKKIKEKAMVVLVARMLWDKGVGEFVEAARLLQQRRLSAQFVLVGVPDDSNPASINEKRLKEWNNEGVVEWWGHRDDIKSVYENSTIACLPSYREGLPKSLLEASASGLPVVTTNVPGCRELISDGVNGFLVPAKNSYLLAEALETLLKNPELRKIMGRNGRKMIEDEFSIDMVINSTLKVYQEII